MRNIPMCRISESRVFAKRYSLCLGRLDVINDDCYREIMWWVDFFLVSSILLHRHNIVEHILTDHKLIKSYPYYMKSMHMI